MSQYGRISFGYGYQCTDREDALSYYRSLYRGDRSSTVTMLREKFLASDLSDISRLSETSRNMAVVNELKTIIDRRIDAMPNSFAVTHEDETAAEKANEWASSPITPKGKSLFSCWNVMTRDQERDGNAVLVLYGTKGDLRVAVRDTEHLQISVDPMTGEESEYRFEWSDRTPGGERVDYSEVITKETRKITIGETVQIEEHRFGFLPVVVIPREEEHGTPVGISGVAELVEAYAFFLWSVYLLNVLDKYESHGVYCPKEDTGAFLPDQTGNAPTNFKLSPGGLCPVPIEKVGGGITAGPLLKQLDQSLESLYRLGKVKRDRGASGDMRSGKALMIDTHELLDYVARKCQLMREGLARLFGMWAKVEGIVGNFQIELPELADDDQAENSKRGELWLKGLAAGVVTEEDVLNAWQRLGLIDQDADLEEMARVIADRKEAANAVEMTRMAATIEGMRQPAEVEDEPEETDGEA